jgi:hypothetical protein
MKCAFFSHDRTLMHQLSHVFIMGTNDSMERGMAEARFTTTFDEVAHGMIVARAASSTNAERDPPPSASS